MTFNYWETKEFNDAVEELVAEMKQTAGLCSAPYFHKQYGWESGVGRPDGEKPVPGEDGGFYWLARALIARGYVKDPDKWK